MARIRTIKPEFFNSFDIASLTPLSRLFYAFLWTESDREGLLEWKPNNYRMRFFPSDNCDISEISEELIEQGLIVIHDGGICEISNFKKHQVINNRESESLLTSRVKVACARVIAEGKEGRKGKEGKGIGASSREVIPYQEIVSLYHETLPTLPRVVSLTDKRKKYLSARWKGSEKAQSLDWWREFFVLVSQSDFLMGKTKDFMANFEWLITDSNFTKVLEGNYDNRG